MKVGRLDIFWDTYGMDQWGWRGWLPYLWSTPHCGGFFVGAFRVLYFRKEREIK